MKRLGVYGSPDKNLVPLKKKFLQVVLKYFYMAAPSDDASSVGTRLFLKGKAAENKFWNFFVYDFFYFSPPTHTKAASCFLMTA